MIYKILLLLAYIAVLVASNNKQNTIENDIEFADFSNHPSLNYSKLTACDCGWSNSNTLKIVNGTATGVNEYPAMAALINLSTGSLYCGAYIISSYFIITAAHCVYGKSKSTLALLVGDYNISSGSDTAYSAVYYVNAYEYHEDYNSNTYENDIALIQTTTQIQFSQYVGPACLPFRYSNSNFANLNVVILGWGQTEFSGPTSDVLLKATLQTLTNTQCDSLQDETILNSEICTYSENKDSCQADSGGPVLWSDSSVNRMFLIGVISHGVGCASGSPGINTRLTSFLSWILNTSGETFCYM